MVPLWSAYAILLSILGMGCAGAWFMSGLTHDVAAHEKRLNDNDIAMKDMRAIIDNDIAERRRLAEESAQATRLAISEAKDRLIRIELQVNFLASQIPSAAALLSATAPAPGPRK